MTTGTATTLGTISHLRISSGVQAHCVQNPGGILTLWSGPNQEMINAHGRGTHMESRWTISWSHATPRGLTWRWTPATEGTPGLCVALCTSTNRNYFFVPKTHNRFLDPNPVPLSRLIFCYASLKKIFFLFLQWIGFFLNPQNLHLYAPFA